MLVAAKCNESTFCRTISNTYEFFLIGLIVVAYVSVSGFQQQTRLGLLAEPKVNDFYFVDYHQIDCSSNAFFRYLPMKVVSVDADTITFRPGNVGHSKQVDISSHVKFDAAVRYNFFKDELLTIRRSEVNWWAEQGILYDIARPERIYINGWIALTPADVVRASQLTGTEG